MEEPRLPSGASAPNEPFNKKEKSWWVNCKLAGTTCVRSRRGTTEPIPARYPVVIITWRKFAIF